MHTADANLEVVNFESTYVDWGVIQREYVCRQEGRGVKIFEKSACVLCGWLPLLLQVSCFLNQGITILASSLYLN